MTVQFMVDTHDSLESAMEYDVVESYDSYEILQVETDNFRKIHIYNSSSGIEYEADAVTEFKLNGKTAYYVSIWNPIN